MRLHAMSQSFVTPYAMLDDDTCLVNHLLNAWFCNNANHICFSKCLLYLLLLKESQDGATLESAHFELQDDKYLVNVHFYMAKPPLSHGDLVFDPRSDLFQGGGDDAEHPTVITMSRVRLASDTCDIYFTCIKVNHLLYTCSLDPLEDGILLDTPSVCMHRYCRNITDVEEECERKGTSTTSVREAWKRRRKKTWKERYYRLQAVLPLRPSKRYYRRTSTLLTLNPTNSCARATRVRYYHPVQAALPLTSGTTALPSGTTALPGRSRGPLALYPSPTYPFVA